MQRVNRFSVPLTLLLLALASSASAGDTITESFQGVKQLKIDLVSSDVIIEVVRGSTVTVEVTHTYDDDCYRTRMDTWGDRLILEEDFGGYGCYGRASWHIKIPKKMDILYSSASGDVEASGIEGELDFDTASGDITLSKINGRITIDNASGRIEIRDAVGDLDIDNASGRIRLENVWGNIEVDNASGRVVIKNATGQFDISNASGDVDASGIVINAESSFTSASGDVEVQLAKKLAHDLSLTSASGDAVLDYNGNPVAGEFIFRARQGRGRIVSPYPFDSEEEFDRGRGGWRRDSRLYVEKRFKRGKNGPRIMLSTVTGTAKLKK